MPNMQKKREIHAPNTTKTPAAGFRERQRREIEARAQNRRRDFIRIAILVFAALCLVALVADLRRLSAGQNNGDSAWNRLRRSIGVSTRGLAPEIRENFGKVPRYTAKNGRFSVEPPAGWRPRAKAGLGMFDAAFDGPHSMDFCIQTTYFPGITEEKLWQKLLRIEHNMQANSHMAFSYIGKRRVITREARLFRNKVLFIDFITGDLMHHVQFSAPPEMYDEYKPLFLKIMESYEPGSVLPPQTAPLPRD